MREKKFVLLAFLKFLTSWSMLSAAGSAEKEHELQKFIVTFTNAKLLRSGEPDARLMLGALSANGTLHARDILADQLEAVGITGGRKDEKAFRIIHYAGVGYFTVTGVADLNLQNRNPTMRRVRRAFGLVIRKRRSNKKKKQHQN